MTEVLFETQTGRLRLDRQSFETLARWAAGTEDPGPEMAALREAGVIEQDRLHPALAAALAAVTDPICRLRVRLVDHDGREVTGVGWITPDAAALLLDLPAGLAELVSVDPTFLPASLARIVRLGPRPRLPAGTPEMELPARRLAALMAIDPARRRQAREALAADSEQQAHPLVASLLTAPWTVWGIDVSWSAKGDAPRGRALRVADIDAGMLRIESTAGTATLMPTTPTELWRRLTLLLPTDDELA